MEVSIFKDMNSKQPTKGTLELVANLMRSDKKLATFTQSYRQTGSKTFKQEAPLFAVACLFEGGKGRDNVRRLTGASLVDIDHGENIPEMKKKAMADPHTLMSYITMSGEGLRVIFKYDIPAEFSGIPKDVDEVKKYEAYYQQAFYAGNAYYEKLLNAKADMQCKNITRLSGLAHDPDVFLRPENEAVPFTGEEITTASAAYAKQSKEDKQMQRIQTFHDTLVAPQLAKAGIQFQSGSHNEYVMRVGYRLAERRFPKKVALKWALKQFGDAYPDTEQVITSCYANVAPHGNSASARDGRGDGKNASVEEIKSFLDGHVSLRFNEITSRVEYLESEERRVESEERRVKSEEFNSNANSTVNTQHSTLSNWTPINDRKVNSLWAEMSLVTRVNKQDLYSIIESDYVPIFNPFVEYLNSLPEWHEGDHDYIADLAATVKVKGEAPAKKQANCLSLRPANDVSSLFTFRSSLKKWLVAMVASWICDDVVNNVILVLIGEQGSFKTTWFNYLLPPELKQYFYTKTNANRMSKDDLLVLAQYALVCCEELDTMRPAELNQLKAVVTMTSIDERAAYAHYHEHRKHIASFCGTGNNAQFLSDPSGNRRWLPFEVESIVSPREHPFNHEGIFAQALALYKSGFQYWFTKEDIQELNRHNQEFETPHLEKELVDLYFRKPREGELGEFMSVARALQIISNGISQKLSAVNVGKAFIELGFKRVRTNSSRGFIVVCRTAEEIKAYQAMMSMNARDEDDLPF